MAKLVFDCCLRYESGFEMTGSFEADGGVTALAGPSGAGKTTVLNLIAGLLRPSKGRIRLGERTLVDTQSGVFSPPEKRHVGMVFQDYLLFPHMTVKANLLFGQGRASSRSIALARVMDILEIGNLLERYPTTLSGGEKQRVALGRALLRGPELLLMDEPLAALDQELKGRILTYLERAVAEWRISTLFVSHNLADAGRIAAKVVILERGKIAFTGPFSGSIV